MVQSAQLDGAWDDPARVARNLGGNREPGSSTEGFDLGPKSGDGKFGTQTVAVLPKSYDGTGVFKFELYDNKASAVPPAIMHVLLSPHLQVPQQASMPGAESDAILVPFRILGHRNLYNHSLP